MDQLEKIVEEVYANGFSIQPDYFDTETVLQLLTTFSNLQSQLKKAAIGNQYIKTINTSIRSDKIVWLNGDEQNLNAIYDWMDELQLMLNRRCYLGINCREFHFAKYDMGDFYKKHKDAFSNSAERKITILIYLNQNWEKSHEGELVLYVKDAEIKVSPKAGTLVVFESHLEHEVLPSNAERISFTGWLKNSKII